MDNQNSILKIEVSGEMINLELYKVNDLEIINREEWHNDGSTSEQLLTRIDVFLGKNNIEVSELVKVETKIDENQKYTLARIIEIIAKTMNYCLANK
jgi:hypothetical protein